MADQVAEPKKRGRKKGSVAKPKAPSKRVPRNLETMSFEQLQELNIRITELMKTKKDQQIQVLKAKLAELEKM
ncbi:MAG TPA: hypothetical protein VHO68_00335 [Bacteroidales bacterium]|nr:hypothetical protein [Bacteroidales bacterium]